MNKTYTFRVRGILHDIVIVYGALSLEEAQFKAQRKFADAFDTIRWDLVKADELLEVEPNNVKKGGRNDRD
ncbi:MAG: hypothetical protein FWH12_02210 [Treponema sp.]|nr:hypothetical protein [Treponema sp.]